MRWPGCSCSIRGSRDDASLVGINSVPRKLSVAMLRYSFILMKRLSAFPSPEAFRGVLATLRDCGYEGVELNITEPLGFDLDLLEKWIRERHLQIPSFLTGEAY